MLMVFIVSLFLDLHPVVARNYTSFSLDPNLKWSEMTEHLRKDDDNTSEEANHQRLYWINQILLQVNYIEFLQNKSILET